MLETASSIERWIEERLHSFEFNSFLFASLLFHENKKKKICTRFGEGGAIDKNGPKCGRLEGRMRWFLGEESWCNVELQWKCIVLHAAAQHKWMCGAHDGSGDGDESRGDKHIVLSVIHLTYTARQTAMQNTFRVLCLSRILPAIRVACVSFAQKLFVLFERDLTHLDLSFQMHRKIARKLNRSLARWFVPLPNSL